MKSSEFPSFRRKLIRWYAARGRDLPWRRTKDPYHIWISEIMLQQTTVAAVIPYFERFLTQFPTVSDLAAAPESDVLRLWEGLGYYSRARNLHKAAQVIVNEYSGQFPDKRESIQSLPGIGRYTAGAIASFAFDQRAPIVEANTLRLYCRLLSYGEDPRSSDGQQVLWAFAEDVLPRVSPGLFNQALMELGATVCSPREPGCESCPVKMHCAAFRQQTTSTIPRLKPKVAITEVTEVSIAVRNGAKYLLRRRTADERWAGLWDFIRFEIDHDLKNRKRLAESVLERTGLTIQPEPLLVELKHAVTRYRITLKCLTAQRVSGRLKAGEEWSWVHPTDFESFPLSVTAREFAERLREKAEGRS